VEGLVNILNNFDTGRLIQQSYYGTGDPPYVRGEFMGNSWGYNPVQGGDRGNHKSKLIDARVSENEVYVKCRPRDWGHDGGTTYSYMENWYRLDGDYLVVDNRFVDFSGWEHPYTGQEVPAFYTVSYLNNYYWYDGDKPWTDDALTNEPDLIFWPDAGYPTFSTQENWAAFTGEFPDSFGIGVYVTGQQNFLAGVYARGEEVGENPAKSGPTSYFAVIEQRIMNSFEPFEYDYYVATGTTEEIRNIFETVK